MPIQKNQAASRTRRPPSIGIVVFVFMALPAGAAISACGTTKTTAQGTQPAATAVRPATAETPFDELIQTNAKRMLDEGKQIFRFDTFGSEDFWGGKLGLHRAIVGEKLAVWDPV